MANQEWIRRDYERAIKVLNSMRLDSDVGHLAGQKTEALQMIRNCLHRLSLSLEQIDKLSIIHVAGTKGKGSTCAYAESILRNHGYKTGLFGSPHLIEVRELIRINSFPVDEEIFTSSVWHVFDKLLTSRALNNGLMPEYVAITLLMAFHIFIKLEVDVVILEVGMGGEYDPTNCILKPVVCGITSLHLEHTEELGHTTEEIAWHKAGIVKEGVPLVTVPHQSSVMSVILNRSNQRGCPLLVAPRLEDKEMVSQLGIAGDRQAINAALALQLCRIWRQKTQQGDVLRELNEGDDRPLVTNVMDIPSAESNNLTQEEVSGLTKTRLPGRNQVVKKKGVTYYLDGAHTTDSMLQCVDWFKQDAKEEEERLGGNVCRTLVFRMNKSRSASDHLVYLTDCGFERAAFCPHVISTTEREKFPDSMDVREDPSEAKKTAESQLNEWEKIKSSHARSQLNSTPCIPKCFPSIVSALWWAGFDKDTPLQEMATADLSFENQYDDAGLQSAGTTPQSEPMKCHATHVQVLVTGSLVMVGGALNIIQPDIWH